MEPWPCHVLGVIWPFSGPRHETEGLCELCATPASRWANGWLSNDLGVAIISSDCVTFNACLPMMRCTKEGLTPYCTAIDTRRSDDADSHCVWIRYDDDDHLFL